MGFACQLLGDPCTFPEVVSAENNAPAIVNFGGHTPQLSPSPPVLLPMHSYLNFGNQCHINSIGTYQQLRTEMVVPALAGLPHRWQFHMYNVGNVE